jgi:H+-translocating NAD(P) transhydrogenase subunit alpha
VKVAVLSETTEGERRVALVPDGVKILKEKGFEIEVQNNAGERAGFVDHLYTESGAILAQNPTGEITLKVLGPTDGRKDSEISKLKSGSYLISFLFPASNLETVKELAAQGVSAFALDLIPRITRAQRMDALSSMSTIAGYRGALLAAEHLPKFFPMFMTAAGTLPPARVLIIGAGVAGLQAIATCKRLGAVVEAFDVRHAVKEQVESLGAKFVDMPLSADDAEDASGYAKEVTSDTHQKELEVIAKRMAKCDVVITTALIPGKAAPILITKEMVGVMPRGSVIVDLAATNGGNCEATQPGSIVVVDGVTIVGSTTLLSDMASDASRMLSRNILEFLLNLAPEGTVKLDLEDPIIHGTLVTHEGKVVHEPTRLLLEKHS